MRVNIFLKSILRQPIRMIVFMILILLCAFTLTMRGVEYLVVTENVVDIGEHYQAVGLMNSTQRDEHGIPEEDIFSGAEVISDHPLVEFEDRRRGYAGIMQGMPNANTGASMFVNIDRFALGFTDAFFYGEVLSKRLDDTREIIVLTISVDEVVQGYPEHVVAGQTLTLHFYPNELSEELYFPNPFALLGTVRDPHTLDGIEVGKRYFMRGVYHDRGGLDITVGPPQVGREDDILAMRPLNERVTLIEQNYRHVIGDELWYLPVPPGEEADLTAPNLEGLVEEMELIRVNQSNILLETTTDMGIVTYLQSAVGVHQIIEGRELTREDYQKERHVAVINDFLANTRGIQLGDTLTISVPTTQYIGGGSKTTDGTIWVTFFNQFALPGQEQEELLLEVEVVGIYSHLYTTAGQMHSGLIYIPDSLIPNNLPIYQLLPEGGAVSLGLPGIDFQFSAWYNFVLDDPRSEDSFMLEMRDELATIGYDIVIIPTGGMEFWGVAEPILQSVSFNLVVFGILVIAILLLVSFLYLRQSRKAFAIAQALGVPKGKLHKQLLVSVTCLSLPSGIIGSIMGWYFAINEATNTLSPLLGLRGEVDDSSTALAGEYIAATGTEINTALPFYWLPIFIIAVLVLILMITLILGHQMSRSSVLELLQGEVKKGRKKQSEHSDGYKIKSNLESETKSERMIQTVVETAKPSNNKTANMRFVLLHIVRSKGKTVLMIGISLLFIIALGYLQEAILRGEAELENLYDTTAVTGEIHDVGIGTVFHYHAGNVIRPQTIQGMLDSGYTRNEFIEAAHEYAVNIPMIDNRLPDNWDEISGINLEVSVMEHFDVFVPILAFNDIEAFIYAHSRDFMDEVGGMLGNLPDGSPLGDMEITFGAGFDKSDFEFTEGEPVPVIISQRVMEEQSIEYGDVFYMGTTYLDTRRWNHVQVLAIGSHNRNVTLGFERLLDATLMPLEAPEYLLGDRLGYVTFRFEIDPIYSRDITRVSEYLTDIVNHPDAGMKDLSLVIRDEELHLVAAPMEQNLSLLRLLYPIVILIFIAVGIGVSLLLMLQNTKIAAIMRVLGGTKRKIGIILSSEQLSLCLFGLLSGLVVLTITNWGFGLISALMLIGLFFLSVLVGSILGIFLVANKSPLEMLQNKE